MLSLKRPNLSPKRLVAQMFVGRVEPQPKLNLVYFSLKI